MKLTKQQIEEGIKSTGKYRQKDGYSMIQHQAYVDGWFDANDQQPATPDSAVTDNRYYNFPFQQPATPLRVEEMKDKIETIIDNAINFKLESYDRDCLDQIYNLFSHRSNSVKTEIGAEDAKEIIFAYKTYCGSKGIVHTDDAGDVVRFSETFANQFRPISVPTEEEIMIYFKNHTDNFIWDGEARKPVMTRSEVLEFADWYASQVKPIPGKENNQLK